MTQTTAAPPAAPPTDDAAPPSAPAARPLPEPKITLAQLDQDFLKDCDAETRDPTDVSEGGEPRVFFARLHQLVLHVAVLRRTARRQAEDMAKLHAAHEQLVEIVGKIVGVPEGTEAPGAEAQSAPGDTPAPAAESQASARPGRQG